MFVKPGRRQDDPALPLTVRGPNKRLLSPQGEHVPEITFWHRRVRDGDVVFAEPPATAAGWPGDAHERDLASSCPTRGEPSGQSPEGLQQAEIKP
jgi:hypothetical protein